MIPRSFRLPLSFLLLLMLSRPAMAQAVLETENLRLEIAADGLLKSLKAKATDTEYAWTAEPIPIASVYRGGEMAVGSQEHYGEHEPPVYRGGRRYAASGASLAGDRLTIRFEEAGVTAVYQVTFPGPVGLGASAAAKDYLAFRLLSLEGEPVDRIDLQLRVKRLPYLGPWINVAYDDRFGVCLCGGNIQTDAGMNQFKDYVEMRAVATREVALEGATAILFGCPDPQNKFLDVMEIVERDFGMPAGAKNRRSPVQKYSYLWCSPTLDDVDQYIAIAKRAGFRMILFSYTAFTRGAGHFRFNERFPNGLDDLKKMADRIRTAGLTVGLHIHYSKADRTDPYVTPVPDDRLHKVRAFALASDMDERTSTIVVRENPAGSALADGRRILKLGQELVAYNGYTTQPGPPSHDGGYRFFGCERGHLKTAPTAHRAGETAALLDVDDWIKFIRFDQTTDIQDEAARRIAEIFNATGPYEMVYFDGAEDVHDPFWHHVASAQYRVYRLLKPAPPVCEAAMNSHFGWHMMTRGNAYDVDATGKHIKQFTREISCRTAPIRAMDFTRNDFGWVFHFYPHVGPDALEYVLSRGAAWDCPFSLRLTLDEVAKHPRAEECFATIKLWEDARIGGKITDVQRAMLRTLDPSEYQFIKTWHAVFLPRWVDAWKRDSFDDQEHHLFLNKRGEYELVAVRRP